MFRLWIIFLQNKGPTAGIQCFVIRAISCNYTFDIKKYNIWIKMKCIQVYVGKEIYLKTIQLPQITNWSENPSNKIKCSFSFQVTELQINSFLFLMPFVVQIFYILVHRPPPHMIAFVSGKNKSKIKKLRASQRNDKWHTKEQLFTHFKFFFSPVFWKIVCVCVSFSSRWKFLCTFFSLHFSTHIKLSSADVCIHKHTHFNILLG